MSNSETNDSKKLSLEDRLQKIKAELEAVIGEVERSKVRLGGGKIFADHADVTLKVEPKWYKGDRGSFVHSHNYGVSRSLEWEKPVFRDYLEQLIPASFFEVNEVLKKVAEKIGFKPGVRVHRSWLRLEDADLDKGMFIYYGDTDTLTFDGYEIYCQGQWAEIIKQSSERKEGWYKKTSGILAHTNGYGININHEWVENQIWMDRNPHLWTPATPKEVEEALIKVAEKMGLIYGVVVQAIGLTDRGVIKGSEIPLTSKSYEYYEDTDEFCLGNTRIYCQGQWAEIISEPKLTLGGYEVKIYENRGHYPIWINHGYFSIEQIEMFSKATQDEYKQLKKATS